MNIRNKNLQLFAFLDSVLDFVIKETKAHKVSLLSKTKQRNIADVRFLFCKLAKEIEHHDGDFINEKIIGEVINRDRTNVYHAIKQVDNVKVLNTRFKELYKKYLETFN
jgi:chromosomal replication initiation ATPase DnaA